MSLPTRDGGKVKVTIEAAEVNSSEDEGGSSAIVIQEGVVSSNVPAKSEYGDLLCDVCLCKVLKT